MEIWTRKMHHFTSCCVSFCNPLFFSEGLKGEEEWKAGVLVSARRKEKFLKLLRYPRLVNYKALSMGSQFLSQRTAGSMRKKQFRERKTWIDSVSLSKPQDCGTRMILKTVERLRLNNWKKYPHQLVQEMVHSKLGTSQCTNVWPVSHKRACAVCLKMKNINS